MVDKRGPLKIIAAVPTYHAVEPEPLINFLVFSQATGKAEERGEYAVRWCVPGPKIPIVVARNAASALSVEFNTDLLLLIDDDMVVPANLLDVLLKRDVDIISPLFFRSNPPIDPLIFEFDKDGNRVPMYDYPKNALFETPAGSGTGVMLIKTSVLKALGSPYWRGTSDPTIGEDVDFCDRARKLGFRTWCDSSVEVRQMNLPVSVGSAHYDQYRLTR
jgi:hypothetical protein